MLRRETRFSGTVGKLCGAGGGDIPETNGDENWAFVNERGKDVSEAAHMTFKHVRKGEWERHDERENGQKRRRETRRKREALEEFKG